MFIAGAGNSTQSIYALVIVLSAEGIDIHLTVDVRETLIRTAALISSSIPRSSSIILEHFERIIIRTPRSSRYTYACGNSESIEASTGEPAAQLHSHDQQLLLLLHSI